MKVLKEDYDVPRIMGGERNGKRIFKRSEKGEGNRIKLLRNRGGGGGGRSLLVGRHDAHINKHMFKSQQKSRSY